MSVRAFRVYSAKCLQDSSASIRCSQFGVGGGGGYRAKQLLRIVRSVPALYRLPKSFEASGHKRLR